MTIKHPINFLPDPESGYCADWESRYEKTCAFKENSPKISIVTPSFNQGQFIEQTIRCILLQGYPNLEYIIVDGGSTDNTLDIIRKYEPWINYWISEPDNGMYDAVNKGFAHSEGEIMAWSPSDDLYEPGALLKVASVFTELPVVEWLTSLCKVSIDQNGKEIKRSTVPGYCRGMFIKGFHHVGDKKGARYCISQQSTFWRRSLWDRSGGIDSTYRFAGDFALWAKFYIYSDLYGLVDPIGIFRIHTQQASSAEISEYLKEQESCFRSVNGRYPSKLEEKFRHYLVKCLKICSTKQSLAALSLLNKTNTIQYNSTNGHWIIRQDYIL